MPSSLSTTVEPSARASTPTQGVALNPQQKSGTQCGAYGWWQEVPKHNNDKQHVVSQPAGQPQSHTKIISFLQNNTSKHMNFTAAANRPTLTVHYAITQHKYIESMTTAVCNTITQCIRDGTMCSRALPSYHWGTLDVALQTKNSSSRGWSTPTMKEACRFLPKKSGHLQNEGETDQDDGRETLTLCSERFVVPGAQNIIRVLRAPNFV